MGVHIGTVWQMRLNDVRGGNEWVCHWRGDTAFSPNYFGQS